ncbi:MAG: hypothetical protein KAH84_03950 [Thiomargarita sp.]|nr:hypothetical protein [Thiomargarita sp.]
MRKKIFYFLIIFTSSISFAQERELLYATTLTTQLSNMTTCVQDIKCPKIAYTKLPEKGTYFARVIPRKYILTTDNKIQTTAVLGGKPIVFFTTPESIYGKSLLAIYLDIGYNTEDIIRWQRNQEMVVILFRYPDKITLSNIRNGKLLANWKQQVYVPTWDNVFTIFHRLTQQSLVDINQSGNYMPKHLSFKYLAQKNFILNFADNNKLIIKKIPYSQLKIFGGDNWLYRKLLEDKLSIFKHFSGNGRTINAMIKNETNKSVGVLEFIGPNIQINFLPEFVIIDLGSLIIEDTYSLSN